jgi:poly(3-hydroxybutyrate) depolymerase
MGSTAARKRVLVTAGLILCAAAVAVTSPAANAGVSPLCGAQNTSGSSIITTTDNFVHKYYYRIPNKTAPASGRPALIWMHGDGGTGAPPFGSSFYPYTDPAGAIVITPTGTGKTWEHAAGDIPGHPQDSQFISKIMDALDTCASVNHGKYFVGGVSRGGFMPYFLLERASTRNRIAAAAINAGGLYCQNADPECIVNSDAVRTASSARIIHLHGTADTVVTPPTARYSVAPGQTVNWNVDWRVFFPMNFWAQQHGCWTGPQNNIAQAADNGVVKETYTYGTRTVHVYDLTGHGKACDKYQIVLVQNGGHVVTGQEGRIWNFLMNRVLCHGYLATITGTGGNNTITGTSGRDVIVGFGGADTIHGNGGQDIICGGDGKDTIYASTDNNVLYGEAGDDKLYAYGGVDKVVGGSGNDFINGGSGADRMYGEAGNDTIYAKDATKDNRIDGGSGTDRAYRDSIDPAPVSVP